MITGIEEIYQLIADKTVEAIPADWTSARIEAVFFSDSSEYWGEYYPAPGRVGSFDLGMEISRAFRAMRRKFREAGHRVWGQASFELLPNGKFNMKWGYENCDENGDTIWNEEEWHRLQEDRRKRVTEA